MARPEMLTRTVAVSGFRVSQSIRAVHNRGEEPDVETGPWLELMGQLDESVKGVSDVGISLYPREPVVIGPVRPASIGAIIGLKPEMSVVISWSEREFDRLWLMALSGELRFASLYFTEPHRNRGLVVSASFSNGREE